MNAKFRQIGAIVPRRVRSFYVAGLAVKLRDMRVRVVMFFTSPTTYNSTSSDGQSIVMIGQDKLKAVQEGFQTDTLDVYQFELQTIG